MKTVYLFFVLFTFGFLFIGEVSAQKTAQSRCPTMAKCLTFVGADTYETNVEITGGAAAILLKNRIALENEGTELVWLDTCKNDKCDRLDLTGRHPNKKISKNNLNKTIKISAIGKMVKIQFEELDGDKGSAMIINGKYTELQTLESSQ